jgi:Mn2+/Fe2+ NRAMP family transporter
MRASAKTEEEIARAHDRMRVHHARRSNRPLLVTLLLVGPGILTMLGENDGPSMISYVATGAAYGNSVFVPIVLLTFAMAYVVQEAAMRVGIATRRGHAELIRLRFGGTWAAVSLGDLLAGNVLTLVAEFVAICSGAAFLGVPRPLAVGIALCVIVAAFATRRYFTWERFALVLALGNLLFLPVALRAYPDAHAIAGALSGWQGVPQHAGLAFFTLVLANIGATVTPWMIFFQQGAVVDKGLAQSDLRHARLDTAAGALLAAVIAIATLAIGAVLYAHRIDQNALRTSADFAAALMPYIGSHASTLFAVAMIEAGLTATVTISASSGYAAAELFGSGKSLNRRFADGPLFYGIIFCSLGVAAAIVLVPGAPLFLLAIFANVAATVFMAPTLIFLLLLTRDREIMGSLVNTPAKTALVGAIAVAVGALSLFYGILAALQR